MNRISIIRAALRVACLASVVTGCVGQPSGDDDPDPAPVSGPYLGQTPPSDEACLFAPGLVSTGMNERDLVISPDGDEIFYVVMERPHYTIVRLQQVDGVWTDPEPASFSGRYDDYEPQFSPDGDRLWFCSVRPLDGQGEPKDTDIWYVDRTAAGWGEPQRPGPPLNTDQDEFYPSVTRDGTVYLTSARMKLYRCRYDGSVYLEREELPSTVNSGRGEYNAYVAPDESYLLFTSHGWSQVAGRGDLFVSFRDPDGTWSAAVCLDSGVNSDTADMSPAVSADGHYLFFASMRPGTASIPGPTSSYAQLQENSREPGNGKFDIYWVDAAVIEKARPEPSAE